MMKLLKKFKTNTNGSTAVEYGLIAGLVGLALVGSLTTLGDQVKEPIECSADVIAGTKTSC